MSDPMLPDGVDWTIAVVATDTGVDLVLTFRLAGNPTKVTLDLDRLDAREFARLMMLAAGDGAERTFPGRSSGEG